MPPPPPPQPPSYRLSLSLTLPLSTFSLSLTISLSTCSLSPSLHPFPLSLSNPSLSIQPLSLVFLLTPPPSLYPPHFSIHPLFSHSLCPPLSLSPAFYQPPLSSFSIQPPLSSLFESPLSPSLYQPPPLPSLYQAWELLERKPLKFRGVRENIFDQKSKSMQSETILRSLLSNKDHQHHAHLH